MNEIMIAVNYEKEKPTVNGLIVYLNTFFQRV